MLAINDNRTNAPRFSADWIRHDPSVVVRSLTATLVNIWPKGEPPKRAIVKGWRQRLLDGRADPVKIVYRLMLAAIDEGKSVAVVCQWLDDMKASVIAYAERHERRQGSGVLPFPDMHTRLVTRSICEDADADVATAQVKAECIASLEKARAERLQAIEADERLVESYTAQIAQLRAKV